MSNAAMVLVKSSSSSRGGRVGGMGVVDEGKVCSVACQRQHVHHQQYRTRASIKMAAQGGDALPVVELRPFTKRVWRREKSLPACADQLGSFKGGDSATTSDNSRGGKDGGGGGIPPPPNIGQFIRQLRDQHRSREAAAGAASSRLSVESTNHLRLKLHPKADFSFDGEMLAGHRQDLIPSFISRQDRSKTMLGEDGVGGVGVGGGGGGAGEDSVDLLGVQDRPSPPPGAVPVRESSNLMAAYTRGKPLQQQNVCLVGDRMPVSLHAGRRHLAYLSPYPRQRQAWNGMRLQNSPTAGLSPRNRLRISFLARDGTAFPATCSSSPMDHASHHLVLAGSLMHSTYAGGRPALQQHRQHNQKRARQSSPHKFNPKLGAARDSFLTLSKSGVPTVLEQNLSFDQEVRLERCRRERSFVALSYFSEANAACPAHHVTGDSQPTPGEATLMRARQANRAQDQRRGAGRRGGVERSGVTLPPFPRQHLILGCAAHGSPTSNKSQDGDSDPSSPGDPPEDSARVLHTTGPALLHSTPAFQPMSASRETVDNRVDELQESSPVDHMGTLPEDMESLVESTDEYQRPLSDTAATEIVHVRNDQTPMSADNRARLLPRYDAYLEDIQTGREHVQQWKHPESNLEDAILFPDIAVDNNPQLAMPAESDAELMITMEAGRSHSGIQNQPAVPSVADSPEPLKKEREDKEAHRKGQNSAGSVSATLTRSDPGQSMEVTTGQTAVDSQQPQLDQQHDEGQTSAKTIKHHAEKTQKPNSVTLGTVVSSNENKVNEKVIDEPSTKAQSLVQEDLTKEVRGSKPHDDDSRNVTGENPVQTNSPVTSTTTSNTADDDVMDPQWDMAEDRSLPGDSRADQEELRDTTLKGSVPTANRPAVYLPPGDERITGSHRNDTNTERNQSVTRLPGIGNGPAVYIPPGDESTTGSHRNNTDTERYQSVTRLPGIGTTETITFNGDQAVSTGEPQSDNPAENNRASPGEIVPVVIIRITSPTDSLGSSSQSRKSAGSDNAVHGEQFQTSHTKTEDRVSGTGSEEKESGVQTGVERAREAQNGVSLEQKGMSQEQNGVSQEQNGVETESEAPNDVETESEAKNVVETAVTVPMEIAESGDGHDASKTFITTANVDSEDWSEMVAV